MPPCQMSLRILLPEQASPSQNEEWQQHSSSSLSLPSAQHQSFNKKSSKWPAHMSQNESLWAPSWEQEKGFAVSWAEEGILCLTDVSLLRLTPWISALSAGCHLEGKASQTLGKAIKVHLSQSFQYPLGALQNPLPVPLGHVGCSSWIGPLLPEHLSEVTPSWRAILLRMLKATKQAAGACLTIRGASLPSGKPSKITIREAGLFLRQNPALVR